MNYMISFALPRFTDQALSRSRKRAFYPAGTPDWVAKLDTVMHELYHIDPEQNCLRRFRGADGLPSDALHSPTYFEDVAELVQQYLASNPDPALLEFLRYDFEGLRARYGGDGRGHVPHVPVVSAPLSRVGRRPARAGRPAERPRREDCRCRCRRRSSRATICSCASSAVPASRMVASLTSRLPRHDGSRA